MDEKRAFMLLVSVAADGKILPFQAIYQGKTKLSLPVATSSNHSDAMDAGFKLEFSGTKTYWSNQETMCVFVNDILVPYFDGRKASGRLTSGLSTVPRISGVDASNILLTNSYQI